ncbi:patatin-like phospholipase family protein [Winogradskyella eckloniae]|uniref:patatin-like phospholipase family protein n=1 Tax=Winogradskyella eckloniae TaxID=1089306 RepID=UPI0015663A42|nr:patatin-like phospholipase family protein [Winogradskyella eckloniae]NRD19078.1 patatin-like phospholipase family protein [Winogradskyella eckloniae]
MKKRYFILCSVLLTFLPIVAQVSEEQHQPKVGLVLSGGGAKGFAHIGVLKVMDSLGLKVDYIAGTSMGAIIGSLYASGYSGAQLEKMFEAQNFDELINDKFPRGSKSFYERENAEKYAVTLPFDKLKISLPSALSRGQNVYNLLYQLMMPVNQNKDFSKLPIPFFCMATDVETGESLLLDKGNLAEAVTASAALPSLFQPVIINGRILVDGGVTNNYPVQELRDKGMDVIIGVDVQDALKDREALKSAPDILLQINNFRTINSMKSKLVLTDVYIKPDISDYSVVSFDKGTDIIANGELAARNQLTELNNLKTKQHHIKKQAHLTVFDSLTIKNVDIKGNSKYTRSYLLGKLKLKGEEKIAYSDFRRGINSLIATNNFDAFRYHLTPTDQGTKFNLVGEVTESEITTFLRLGIHFDELYKSAILANITKKKLLFNNDIASLDIILGDNSRYNFDYFIDKGYYISLGAKSSYNQFHKSISPSLALEEDSSLLVGVNKLDAEVADLTNQVYLQTIFQKDFALRLGGEHRRFKITSETIIEDELEDEITFDNTNYFSVYGNLIYDDFDNAHFPKSGFYVNADFHLYLNATGFNTDFDGFSIAKADFGYAFSFNDKLALKTEANGGFKIGSKSTNTLDFAFGGYGANFLSNFYSFYGYDFISIIGNSFVKSTFTLDYEFHKGHHILGAANFANIDDDLFETGQFFSSPDYTGYALGYSLETFIGPLEGKFSYSPDTGDSYWYFNLGFWF